MNIESLNSGVKRVSLVDSIYETLVEAIVTRQLAPGVELNSVALSRQLEVSRTPLREALKLLERDGLVQQAGNQKARVTEFTADDIREIYEVRLQLEAAAAELSAKKMPETVLNDLRSEAQRLSQQTGDVDWRDKAVEFDMRFHEAIAQSSGNRRLAGEIQRFRLLVRSFCLITGDPETLEQALKEHIAILEALATGRPAAARKAMAHHVSSRMNSVLEQLTKREGSR